MKKIKKQLTLAVVILLLLGFVSIDLSEGKTAAYSTETKIKVLPEVVEFGPGCVIGQTFTIAVVVENVVDSGGGCGGLYGLEIQFSWNTTYLEYVSHTKTIPVDNYSNPIPPSPYPGILHSPFISTKDDVDENAGMPGSEPGTMYWLGVSSLSPAPDFMGNGTAFTMTFRVKNQSEVVDVEFPLHFTSTALVDMCTLIYHSVEDGLIRIPRRKPPPDINNDGIVDIHDVVICALAFGSRPGDPNWNPCADLNNDGLIDIFDMVRIGINYGKKW